MTVSGRLFAVAAAVAMISSAAAALTSDEVLVVANASNADSVALAEIYSQARQIPPSHVLALKVTTNYSISREDYLSQIVSPISQYLLGKNLATSIKCIVLMFGMPARVDPPANPYAALNSIYNIEVKKCHYRLAVDYHLLATVCRKFPPPRTDGLTPLADLFETPVPAPSEPLTEWSALVADADKIFSSKIAEMKALKDPVQREIASRQMMALAIDIHGLEGLIKLITDAGLTDAPDVAELKKQLDQARLKQNDLRARQMDANSVSEMMASLRESGGVVAAEEYAAQQAKVTATVATTSASVDSELSMIWQGKYPLDSFLINPLFWRVDPKSISANTAPVLMTCRLDGPGRDYVARMIRDSVEVEKTGLSGTFYIDAGGPERAKQYDATFRKLDRFLRDNTKLKVVLDESAAVFQPGACPNAALYCGWYSLQKYVPAFDWVKGSVGWHVASFEAIHLRDPNSDEWCPKMIQNGIAATVGAVEEPYLNSFPHPDDFFPLLLTGTYTLAECYWRTVPLTSWRLMLIGDPLYNPFKANPQVDVNALPPDLLPPVNFPSLGRISPAATTFTTSTPTSQPATASQPK